MDGSAIDPPKQTLPSAYVNDAIEMLQIFRLSHLRGIHQ